MRPGGYALPCRVERPWGTLLSIGGKSFPRLPSKCRAWVSRHDLALFFKPFFVIELCGLLGETRESTRPPYSGRVIATT